MLQDSSIFILLPAWPFLFFSQVPLVTGPIAFSFGVPRLVICWGCRASPWSRLWEGSSFWFMRTWPGMELLCKNSALLLSESSRRKWWIAGIRRIGHLSGSSTPCSGSAKSLLPAVDMPSWLSAWSLTEEEAPCFKLRVIQLFLGSGCWKLTGKEWENNTNLNFHDCHPLTQ